jgi:glutamyl-tRNA synthetase
MTDFPDATEFFFDNHPKMDRDAAEKWRGSRYVDRLLHLIRQGLPAEEDEMTAEACEALVTGAAKDLNLEKRGDAIHPLRLALTGRTKGPGLFELMSLLGAERMRERLEFAEKYFG